MMNIGQYCGFACSQDQVKEIYNYLEKNKDRISFLTTTKALYDNISAFAITEKIACRYLCNNLERLDKLLPSFKCYFNIHAVKLKCGDHNFPLSIQYFVFSELFKIGHFTKFLKLIINGKNRLPLKEELNDLIKVMKKKDLILNAFYCLELFFVKLEDNFHRICDYLPFLNDFKIYPIFENALIDDKTYMAYIKLFNDNNFLFLLDVAPYLNYLSNRKVDTCCYMNSAKKIINFFKNQVFNHTTLLSRVVTIPTGNEIESIGLLAKY